MNSDVLRKKKIRKIWPFEKISIKKFSHHHILIFLCHFIRGLFQILGILFSQNFCVFSNFSNFFHLFTDSEWLASIQICVNIIDCDEMWFGSQINTHKHSHCEEYSERRKKTDNAIAIFVECQYFLCVCMLTIGIKMERKDGKWTEIANNSCIQTNYAILCQARAYYVIVSAVPNKN